jgi:putative lipoic acid-binding regulatory protein
MTEQNDEHFNFPCDFPIKIMGRSNCELENLVMNIVAKHAPEVTENELNTRPSGKGNFISVTITIKATSREQLDNIYLELTALEEVLMAL